MVLTWATGIQELILGEWGTFPFYKVDFEIIILCQNLQKQVRKRPTCIPLYIIGSEKSALFNANRLLLTVLYRLPLTIYRGKR